MENLIKIITYSFFAGATVFLGGLLSKFFEKHFKEGVIKDRVIRTSIAFGGGIIVAAVAFVLAPEGMDRLSVLPMSIIFLAGGLSFFFLDRYLDKKGGTVAQLMAMMMDFIPEAIALGAMFATNHNLGLLLAIFMGLQNLPESFNAYIELRSGGFTSKKCLIVLFILSFPGILAAVAGDLLLSDLPQVTDAMMLFSSGGILYLIFQDIAPLSKSDKSWFPALGVNLGFLVGMIGHKLLG